MCYIVAYIYDFSNVYLLTLMFRHKKFNAIVKKIKGKEGIVKQRKKKNQFECVHRMNNIQQQAKWIGLNELS